MNVFDSTYEFKVSAIDLMDFFKSICVQNLDFCHMI